MKNKGNISAFQFFCTLFVCRIIALFTFIITDQDRFPPGDRMVIVLPFILVGLLTAVPAMLVIGPMENRTIFSLTDSLSPALTRLTAALYAAGAVWSAAVSAVRFELFMSTVMFSGAALFGLIVLLLLSALLIARRGLETVARMSVAVTALLAVSLIYVIFTTAKDFDPANLSPPLQKGLLPLAENSFSAAARTSELAALFVLSPKIKGPVKKGFLFWLTIFGGTVSGIYTLILGVTGAYGERQMFQLYALTVLSKIGVIERLDSLICAIWVLCSLLRLAFYLMTGSEFLKSGFGIRNDSSVLIGLSAALLAVCAVLSPRIALFSAILGSGANEIVFSVLLIGLPLTLLTAKKIKNGRRRIPA